MNNPFCKGSLVMSPSSMRKPELLPGVIKRDYWFERG